MKVFEKKYNDERYVTPLMYGAIGDGINDDTDALQTALNTGKHVVIPENCILKLSKDIFLPSYTHLTINGKIIYFHNVSKDTTISMNTFDGITETPLYSASHDILIDGCGIIDDCGQDYQFGTGCTFRIHHAKNVTIKDITIANTVDWHTIESGGTDGLTIENVKFLGMFNNNSLSKTREFIQLEWTTEGGVSGCLPYDNIPTKNVIIRNCIFDSGEQGGTVYCAIGSHGGNLTREPLENILIENCTFRNSTLFNETSLYDGFLNGVISFKICTKNVVIRNNVFENLGASGISFGNDCTDTLIENNIFRNINHIGISFNNSNDYPHTNAFIKNNLFVNCCLEPFQREENGERLTIRFRTCKNVKIIGNIINYKENLTGKARGIHIPNEHYALSEGIIIENNKINYNGNIVNFNDFMRVTRNDDLLFNERTAYGNYTFNKELWEYDGLLIYYSVGGMHEKSAYVKIDREKLKSTNKFGIVLHGLNLVNSEITEDNPQKARLYELTIEFTKNSVNVFDNICYQFIDDTSYKNTDPTRNDAFCMVVYRIEGVRNNNIFEGVVYE